eukprot:s201_g18.t1
MSSGTTLQRALKNCINWPKGKRKSPWDPKKWIPFSVVSSNGSASCRLGRHAPKAELMISSTKTAAPQAGTGRKASTGSTKFYTVVPVTWRCCPFQI